MGIVDVAARSASAAQDRLGNQVVCSLPFANAPPLVIEARPDGGLGNLESGIEWVRSQQEAIEDAVCDVGAVVLRGFGPASTTDFEAFLAHMPAHSGGYVGGSTPRQGIDNSTRVYEATRSSPEIRIPLHQEMTYLPNYPGKLAFFCRLPSATGGQTLLGDMRRFTASLPDRILSDITARGIRYIRNFRSEDVPHPAAGHPVLIHLTWQHAFSSKDPDAAEATARKLGLETRWESDDSLTTFYRSKGLTEHRKTGERVYSSHLHTQIHHPRWMHKGMWEAYSAVYGAKTRPIAMHAQYGDAEEFNMDDYYKIHDLLDAVTVAPVWRAGDILLVDNIYTAHGRGSFTGDRDVQVSLLA